MGVIHDGRFFDLVSPASAGTPNTAKPVEKTGKEENKTYAADLDESLLEVPGIDAVAQARDMEIVARVIAPTVTAAMIQARKNLLSR